jgi:hypothetical protein
MTKTIKFITTDPNIYGVFNPPEPASNVVPDWYKKQNKYVGGQKQINRDMGTYNHTIKACMPVFDMLTAGYIFTLAADILVEKDENGNTHTSWSTDLMQLVQHHGPEQYNMYNIPNEFEPIGFKFIQPWVTQTPAGYSSLFISPTYRDDLPFYSLPAVVDTDSHPMPVNFPFFIRKDFVGIIPMGTPIMQVIPFKREEWKSESSLDTSGNLDKIWQKAKRKIGNNYKTFFRTQKVWK